MSAIQPTANLAGSNPATLPHSDAQLAFDSTHAELLDFGAALTLLKHGATVARVGWNGKGMFIWLKRGSTDRSQSASQFYAGVPGHLLDSGHEGTATRLPCICMRAAGGETVEGWLASQSDQLAEDWVVVAEAGNTASVDLPASALPYPTSIEVFDGPTFNTEDPDHAPADPAPAAA